MDRAIHSTTAQQRRVGCIDDRFGFLLGNVPADDFYRSNGLHLILHHSSPISPAISRIPRSIQ
jgi:hypothetical protein